MSLAVDYGFIQKLNLHQINRMKDKIFSQPVNVFIYIQANCLISYFNMNSLVTPLTNNLVI